MTCETCGEGPCLLPTFCEICRKADEWWAKIPPDHPLRIGPIGNLPKGWRTMNEDRLAAEIERRRRRHG